MQEKNEDEESEDEEDFSLFVKKFHKFVKKKRIERRQNFNIVNEKTTTNLMKALSDMYEKPSAANKVYLMRRLINLKIGEGISVTNHIYFFNES